MAPSESINKPYSFFKPSSSTLKTLLKNTMLTITYLSSWFSLAVLIRQKLPRPPSLEQEPEDGHLTLNYYSNYNSLCHAFYMIITSNPI